MPPGGLLTYWTGCVMEKTFWWCIMRSCRSHWCPHYDPSLPSSIPVSVKSGSSVLSATRMATSSAQVHDGPALTPSPQIWNGWLMATSALWTRPSEPATILACQRSISQDDRSRTRVQDCLSRSRFSATSYDAQEIFWYIFSSHIEVRNNAICAGVLRDRHVLTAVCGSVCKRKQFDNCRLELETQKHL